MGINTVLSKKKKRINTVLDETYTFNCFNVANNIRLRISMQFVVIFPRLAILHLLMYWVLDTTRKLDQHFLCDLSQYKT